MVGRRESRRALPRPTTASTPGGRNEMNFISGTLRSLSRSSSYAEPRHASASESDPSSSGVTPNLAADISSLVVTAGAAQEEGEEDADARVPSSLKEPESQVLEEQTVRRRDDGDKLERPRRVTSSSSTRTAANEEMDAQELEMLASDEQAGQEQQRRRRRRQREQGATTEAAAATALDHDEHDGNFDGSGTLAQQLQQPQSPRHDNTSARPELPRSNSLGANLARGPSRRSSPSPPGDDDAATASSLTSEGGGKSQEAMDDERQRRILLTRLTLDLCLVLRRVLLTFLVRWPANLASFLSPLFGRSAGTTTTTTTTSSVKAGAGRGERVREGDAAVALTTTTARGSVRVRRAYEATPGSSMISTTTPPGSRSSSATRKMLRMGPRAAASGVPRAPRMIPKTLVLDLDETLIHSTSRSPTLKAGLGLSAPGRRGKSKLSMRHVEVILDGRSTVYTVYKRPWVDYFLRKVSAWYTVVIFTASVREYADPVIDWLDGGDGGGGMVGQRLFRSHCLHANGSYVKDLAIVGQDLSNVCLIDNSPASFAINKANGIPIEGWIDDPYDECLLDLLPMLDSLRFTNDVRRVLGLRGFGNPIAT